MARSPWPKAYGPPTRQLEFLQGYPDKEQENPVFECTLTSKVASYIDVHSIQYRTTLEAISDYFGWHTIPLFEDISDDLFRNSEVCAVNTCYELAVEHRKDWDTHLACTRPWLYSVVKYLACHRDYTQLQNHSPLKCSPPFWDRWSHWPVMIQNIVEYKVTKRSRGHCRCPLVDIVCFPDGDETVPQGCCCPLFHWPSWQRSLHRKYSWRDPRNLYMAVINPANGDGNAAGKNRF